MQTDNDRLTALWLAEAIRRKEQAGVIDDAEIIAQMAREPAHDRATDEALICRRADLMTQHNPVVAALPTHISNLSAVSRIALLILTLTAILAGVSLAGSALLQGTPLNVFLLLFVLLIPHLLGLLWIIALYSRLGSSSPLIADLWIWLTKRLGRRQDAVLLVESLRSLLSRTGRLPLMLLGISHWWWTLFALSAMLTVYFKFSVAEYAFTWGTTIQRPAFFLDAIRLIGWLPGLLGFSPPDMTGGPSPADDSATRWAWGWFVLGCLAVYALAPRLLLFAFSWAAFGSGLRHLSIDTADAYYINVLSRIKSALRKPPDITDAAPAHLDATGVPAIPVQRGAAVAKARGVVPFELRDMSALAADQAVLPREIFNNVVDGISQQAVLDGLRECRIGDVILVFDARNTADRGAFQFLHLLQSTCDHVQVVLLNQEAGSPNKLINWLEGLKEIGFDTVLHDIPAVRSSAARTS